MFKRILCSMASFVVGLALVAALLHLLAPGRPAFAAEPDEPVHAYSSDVLGSLLVARNPGDRHSLIRTDDSVTHPPAVADSTGRPLPGNPSPIVQPTNLASKAEAFTPEHGAIFGNGLPSRMPTQASSEAGLGDATLLAAGPDHPNIRLRPAYAPLDDPPVASFTGSPTSGTEPLLVYFQNYSLNATSVRWNFGDGSFSTSWQPGHLYLQPGVYTVTLTAFNPVGSSELIRPAYITVHPLPQPGFSAAPRMGLDALTVTFTNTSQFATSFLWDYGDGSTSNTVVPTHTHVYTAPGNYDVSLTAASEYGSATLTQPDYIKIYESPVADFEAAPREGLAPLEVAFTNLSSGATYYSWYFGDGATSTAVNPVHIYASAGVYTVSLTAGNVLTAAVLTRTAYITALQAPVIDLAGITRIGPAPLEVTFVNGTQFADSFLWDYGDGETSTTDALTHTHNYLVSGVYTVTLTAVNVNGQVTEVFDAFVAALDPPLQTAYYVDALGGSNVDGNGSVNQPWRTLTYALSQVAGPDTTVFAASGVYDQALGEVFPINMEPGVTLQGAHPTASVIAAGGAGHVVYFSNAVAFPENTVLRDFKITGGTTGVRVEGSALPGQMPVIENNWITGNVDGINVYAYATWRYAYPILRNNRIAGNTRYGIFGDADSGNQSGKAYANPVIMGNQIVGNGADGILCDAYGFSSIDRGYCSPIVTDNLIAGNGSHGVRGKSGYAGACNIQLVGNVIANNQGWGFRRTEGPTEYWTVIRPKLINNLILGNGSGGVNVHKKDEVLTLNNTIVDNGPYGVKRENTGETAGFVTIVNSIVWAHADNLNNVNASWVSYSDLGDGEYGGSNNNISTDPLFADPNQDDYHLMSASPAINAGDNSHPDLPVTDFDGQPRIFQGVVDMGADEWHPALLVAQAADSVVAAGSPLTYTLVVTNYTASTLNLVVTDTLPAEVQPSGVLTWNLVLAAVSSWTETVIVTVAEDYAGPLTNVVVAQSDSGITAGSAITSTSEIAIQDLAADNNGPSVLGQATILTATITQGSNVAYEWSFGDGATGEGAVVSHVYPAPGIYLAVVTASNLVSVVATTTTVVVDEPITGLAASNDGPTTLGATTTLSAASVTGSNVDYTWDLGDGTAAEGAVVTHVYPGLGAYAATVTATNSVGSQSAETVVAIVDDAIGGLTAVNDGPTILGQPTTFTATVTSGTSISYSWSFGDGAFDSGQVVSHTYPAAGIYTAAVTAINSVNTETALTVALVDEAISGLAAENDSPTELGQPTTFTATVTAGTSVSYTWDFGDGLTGTGDVVQHTYNLAGTYTAIVTAVNPVSLLTTTTSVVVAQPIAGLAALNDGPTSLGEPTTLTATITAGSDVTYGWEFGDGATGAGAVVQHSYGAVGVFTAVVTASNQVSAMTATTTVIVEEPILGLAVVNDSPTSLGEATIFTVTVASGSNVSYTWDFGDGTQQLGEIALAADLLARGQVVVVTEVVSHTYAAAGDYTATVTASNALGQAPAGSNVTVLPAPRLFLPVMLRAEAAGMAAAPAGLQPGSPAGPVAWLEFVRRLLDSPVALWRVILIVQPS